MITITQIKITVARHYGIHVKDLERRSRAVRCVFPRQVAMSLSMELSPFHAASGVAEHFGSRDKSTVAWACARVREICEVYPQDRQKIDLIRRELGCVLRQTELGI